MFQIFVSPQSFSGLEGEVEGIRGLTVVVGARLPSPMEMLFLFGIMVIYFHPFCAVGAPRVSLSFTVTWGYRSGLTGLMECSRGTLRTSGG